jgi:hypothetical protein
MLSTLNDLNSISLVMKSIACFFVHRIGLFYLFSADCFSTDVLLDP